MFQGVDQLSTCLVLHINKILFVYMILGKHVLKKKKKKVSIVCDES